MEILREHEAQELLTEQAQQKAKRQKKIAAAIKKHNRRFFGGCTFEPIYVENLEDALFEEGNGVIHGNPIIRKVVEKCLVCENTKIKKYTLRQMYNQENHGGFW